MSRSLRAHLLMTLVVAIWGATFVVVKDALGGISPQLFNLLRMAAALLCLAVVYRRQWKRMDRRAYRYGAIVGICLALGYQFQTAGLRLTTPSKAAFITGLFVVFVPLLSAIPGLRPPGIHRLGWNVWLGSFAALAGIVLLTAPAGAATPGLPDFSHINLGDLLCLGCAVGFALQVVAIAHAVPHVPFEQLSVLQVGFAALFIAIGTPLLERPWMHPSWNLVFAIAIAGLLATALAFSVQSWAQQFLPATHLAVILALEPVFAWITSFLVSGEEFTLRASAGALLILAGIGITELAARQPTAPREVPYV